MGRKSDILIFWMVLVLLPVFVPQARGEDTPSKEYRIKAAFLFNFLGFVDWPEEKMGDRNNPLVIGIIGKDSFGNAFSAVKGKAVKGRRVLVRRFENLDEIERQGGDEAVQKHLKELGECHMLFICSSESPNAKRLIESLKKCSILIVGDMAHFLEAGGTINLVMRDNKVQFEISLVAAKASKLKIRSQLLRLAKKVIGPQAKSERSPGADMFSMDIVRRLWWDYPILFCWTSPSGHKDRSLVFYCPHPCGHTDTFG